MLVLVLVLDDQWGLMTRRLEPLMGANGRE